MREGGKEEGGKRGICDGLRRYGLEAGFGRRELGSWMFVDSKCQFHFKM